MGLGGLKDHQCNTGKEGAGSGDQTVALSVRLQQRWDRRFSRGPRWLSWGKGTQASGLALPLGGDWSREHGLSSPWLSLGLLAPDRS